MKRGGNGGVEGGTVAHRAAFAEGRRGEGGMTAVFAGGFPAGLRTGLESSDSTGDLNSVQPVDIDDPVCLRQIGRFARR